MSIEGLLGGHGDGAGGIWSRVVLMAAILGVPLESEARLIPDPNFSPPRFLGEECHGCLACEGGIA
jgi:hypothetical protein